MPSVLKDEIRRVEVGLSSTDDFVRAFLAEADRVDAFFKPEFQDALDHTDLLVQRAADYAGSDIACVSGLASLSEALASIVRK